MQLGLHVIEAARLGGLERHGLSLSPPWTGLLDALRAIEGLEDEPVPGDPLVLTGLTVLLREAPSDPSELLQAVRSGLGEGRSFFEWKKIPVVLLTNGALRDPQDGTGLVLEDGHRCWGLAPLVGTRLKPARPTTTGWWWSPQLL